jgi:DNA-entry nuclease
MHKSGFKRHPIAYTVLIIGAVFTLVGATSDSKDEAQTEPTSAVASSSSTKPKASSAKSTSSASAKSTSEVAPVDEKINTPVSTAPASDAQILSELVTLTDQQAPGENKNYYWDNGSAQFTEFDTLTAGSYKFTADANGRSSTARAVLTQSQWEASKGSRQGSPLDPPAWPENEMVAISFALTGRIYHGYLYNRSHSIADSLLGAASYSSPYNFTTGTRSQNVGANQNGGMRAAEELAENYWASHPNTTNTIRYQTTPVYKGDEHIPRGSIVDIQSSDNSLNTEIIVINSAEGIAINYEAGNFSATKAVTEPALTPTTPAPAVTTPATGGDYTADGKWYVAAQGQVFVAKSGIYYSQVTFPDNFTYMSEADALNHGYRRGLRGNGYAKP